MKTIKSANPLITLLAEAAQITGEDRVLLLNGDDPVMLMLLQERSATTDVYVERASTLAELTLAVGSDISDRMVIHSEPFPTESIEREYDIAIVILPKGREHGRALLWSARQALRPGGLLYLLGANDSGIKALIADAELLFGSARTLTTHQRCRIGVAVQPTQVLTRYPDLWGALPTAFQHRSIAGLDLVTLPGVFSWQALDDGTALLLETLSQSSEPAARLLDVGCGYGVIGVYMVTHGLAGQATLTDDQLIAVRCARLNADAFGDNRIDVLAGDLYNGLPGLARGTFDRIVSNPPFHQGFATDNQMTRRLIAEAANWLRPDGRLTIVGNAFLRYDRLLSESFGQVTPLRETPQYTVWEAHEALKIPKK